MSNKAQQRIGIIGAGSWGIALALLLSRNGHPVRLWCHSPERADALRTSRESAAYLPGIRIPAEVSIHACLDDCIDSDILLVVVPSMAFREVAKRISKCGISPEADFVSCTKGIEHESGKLMTSILEEELGIRHAAVLSGPNLADEVARGIPSAAVIGCVEPDRQRRLQEALNSQSFRVYRSGDISGIQLGGALKNIFAIAAGCADGFGMGNNTKAALVTRSLAEMSRLGAALGGAKETFFGLSGVGDLMVTCFGGQSRNRQFGERLGQGESPSEIAASLPTVAEGVPTALSAWQQARRLGAETPIIDGVHAVLHLGADPRQTMAGLLGREPKPEHASTGS